MRSRIDARPFAKYPTTIRKRVDMPDPKPAPILHGVLQVARGMCSDAAPYAEIDAALARAVDMAKDLEHERDNALALVAALDAAHGVSAAPPHGSLRDLPPERACSVCGRTYERGCRCTTWIGQT